MEAEEFGWIRHCYPMHSSNESQWPVYHQCASEDKCKGESSEHLVLCYHPEHLLFSTFPCFFEISKYFPNHVIPSWQLGGLNSMLTVEHAPAIPMVSKVPTIILGMDVSHGSPGQSDVPSIAAVWSLSIFIESYFYFLFNQPGLWLFPWVGT